MSNQLLGCMPSECVECQTRKLYRHDVAAEIKGLLWTLGIIALSIGVGFIWGAR